MTVSNITITRAAPYENGKAFNNSGSYTEIDLTVEFEIDVEDYAHTVITDLPLSKDTDGIVRFSADAKILTPKDSTKSNRKLILDVPNRGRNLILKMLNNTPEVSATSTGWGEGNAFLFDQGYTLTWCGWQHDVPDTPGLLTIKGPQPHSHGSPISGMITMTIQTNVLTRNHLLSERGHTPLPTEDLNCSSATLTVQDNESSLPETINREEWSFGKEVDGKFSPDPNYVYLESGFKPGLIYRVTYPSINKIANGIGLIATRDWVSYIKSNPETLPCPSIQATYGFGHSQSGRFLRHFLYLGLNLDRDKNIVFDGIIAHAAGARRGEFNQRFAQPSSAIKQSTSNLPPFVATDPGEDPESSLLGTQFVRGGIPKLFLVNTASEYWWAHASLSHTTPDGKHDIEPDENCRMYFYSGTQHSSGKFPLTKVDSGNGVESKEYFNFIDYRPSLRALFTRLSDWVEQGVAPPANRLPRIDNGTLIPYQAIREIYETSDLIPDPVHIKQISQMEFSDDLRDVQNVPKHLGEPLPVMVPSIDKSFNEYSGITLPEVQASLGIHLGWNLRHPNIGGTGQIIGTIGASIITKQPLPLKQDYLDMITQRFDHLIQDGFLLEFDRDYVLAEASLHYDAIRSIKE